MKIIYEQGDVVYNTNNYTYGVVMRDYDESASIIEIGGKDVFVNRPPKAALKYCGHMDLKKKMGELLHPFNWED